MSFPAGVEPGWLMWLHVLVMLVVVAPAVVLAVVAESLASSLTSGCEFAGCCRELPVVTVEKEGCGVRGLSNDAVFDEWGCSRLSWTVQIWQLRLTDFDRCGTLAFM